MKQQKEFTSLELRDCARLLLRRWAKSFGCKNIHWITSETLKRLATVDRQTWRWSLDAEQNIESLRPVELDRLFDLWRDVGRQLPVDLHRPKNLELSSSLYVIAPVIGPQASHVIGYFLFEKPRRKVGVSQLARLKNKISHEAGHLEFCWQYAQVKTQSYMDDLTDLYNQRYLPVVFEREISRIERVQGKFSVLFMDIDYFKRVNDTRGHWIGSRLLVEVSKILKNCTRACDYVFRYGGDEFVIVLVDSNGENSQKVAERIRDRIERHQFVVDGESMNLTVSIGLAVFPDHAKSTVELIRLADQAMYYGKHKSRNIVYCAG